MSLPISEAARLVAFAEERKRYRKIDFVHWSPVQRQFLDAKEKFLYLRCANQFGKTFAIGGLIAYAATGLYPADWNGWVPEVSHNEPYGVSILAMSVTSQVLRDGLQTILIGDYAGGSVGTGLIPKEAILSLTPSRGIAGALDLATVKRSDGTTSIVRFKTYEQGRSAVQGFPAHLVAFDELTDDIGLFNEAVARTTGVKGRVRVTATERMQASPVARFFKEQAGVVTLTASLDQAEHLDAATKAEILASYTSEAERQARYYGLPFQGAGSVFETPWSEVAERMNPATFPEYWKHLIAVDFSHFGQSSTSSQFAAVFLAVDPLSNTVRIYDAFRSRGVASEHVAKINAMGGAGIPVAWPHDGAQGQADGTNIQAQYKALGLRMLPSHATFKEGGYNFESGVELMTTMFGQGRLKIASHLTAYQDEYLAYERGEDGKVIKRLDDMLSASRVGVMSIRFARPLDECEGFRRRDRKPVFAKGSDAHEPFDLFAT